MSLICLWLRMLVTIDTAEGGVIGWIGVAVIARGPLPGMASAVDRE
jgi:hypothetical protein